MNSCKIFVELNVALSQKVYILDSNLQKIMSNNSIKRKVRRGAHHRSVSKGSSGDTEQNIWSNFDPKARHFYFVDEFLPWDVRKYLGNLSD